MDSQNGMWEVNKLGEHIQETKTLCRNILGTLNQLMLLFDSTPSKAACLPQDKSPHPFSGFLYDLPLYFSIFISCDSSSSLLSRYNELLSGPSNVPVIVSRTSETLHRLFPLLMAHILLFKSFLICHLPIGVFCDYLT